MREYGFLLTHTLPYKDKICPYTAENESVKTRILAYLMQCGLIHTYFLHFIIQRFLQILVLSDYSFKQLGYSSHTFNVFFGIEDT